LGSLQQIIMTVAERQETHNFPSGELERDCYSRAFFLAGKIPKERPLQKREIVQFLKSCEPINRPVIGSFVWIIGNDKEHIAVVEALQPVTVTDRNGKGGEVRKNLRLTDVLFEFGGLDTPMIYLQHK
jgi:hypothetical protein